MKKQKIVKWSDIEGISMSRYTGIIYLDVRYNDKGYYYLDNGGLHRLGGPAIIRLSGGKEYWIKDKQVSKEKQEFLYEVYLSSKEEYYDILKLEGFL